MNIYILTEITKRELDSNILLALVAAQNGCSVLISNMDSIEFLVKKKLIKKGIFHTKGILHDQRKQNLHLNLVKSGINITSLDEENGLVKKKLDNFCATRFSLETLKVASKIFCWGNHDYNHLKKTYKEMAGKFCKTGTPRIDLWKKFFIPYWLHNSEKKSGKVILISLNFGLVNGFESSEKIIKKLEYTGYFKRSKFFKKEILEIYEQNKKDFIHFKDLINYLSDNFKDITFIVRPHPREKVSTWKKILNKNDNIIVNNENNFNAVLSRSDLLIQNGCTTAFQAAIYNIPIISYIVKNSLKSHGIPPNDLGLKISSMKKVKQNIEEYFLNKKNLRINTKKILSEKLFLFEKELSSYKIFKEWEKINPSNNKQRNSWKMIRLQLFFHDLRNIFKKDNKFEEINIDKITQKVNKLKKILKFKEKFHIIKISNKSFLIQKDN